MILLPRIDHRHQPDRPGVNQRERHDRFLAQHQHIHRIVILGQRLRDEPVIRGVIDGRIEHPIELDQAAVFIQLILDARSERNLDDAIKLLGDSFAGSDVMPGMNHGVEGSGFGVQGSGRKGLLS